MTHVRLTDSVAGSRVARMPTCPVTDTVCAGEGEGVSMRSGTDHCVWGRV